MKCVRSGARCHAVDGASKACHGCGRVHGFAILSRGSSAAPNISPL